MEFSCSKWNSRETGKHSSTSEIDIALRTDKVFDCNEFYVYGYEVSIKQTLVSTKSVVF